MSWTGSNWELQNITGITLPTEITITSSAAGGGSAYLTPVTDRTPSPYPPACNSNNGMDQIIVPLDKAHFDPDKNDELHVKARNVINLSYGARLFMTYSETVASQTVYELPWESSFTFEFIGEGFTWNPGATVTVWSENDQGQVMDVACNQPVVHKNMNDTITVSKAEWDPATDTLIVWAENTATNTTQLYIDYDPLFAQPMTWNSSANRWQLDISGINYFNTVRIYSDANGDITANVLDLYPDTINSYQAYWKPDTIQGNLYIQATNTQGPHQSTHYRLR